MQVAFFNAEYAENYAEGAEQIKSPCIFRVLCVASAPSVLKKPTGFPNRGTGA